MCVLLQGIGLSACIYALQRIKFSMLFCLVDYEIVLKQ